MVKKKIIKKNSKFTKPLHSSTNTNIDLKKIILEKKGIIIAIIILLTAILLLFFGPSPIGVSEEYAYAVAYHEQAQTYFDEINAQLETDINNGFEVDLDQEYYLSIKEDIAWLKEKDNEIFYSGGQLFIKEVAFMLFAQEIINLNQDFTTEFGEPVYDSTIELALTKEYSNLVFPEEIYSDLEPQEKIIFEDTLNTLSKEYYDFKINLINTTYTERAYVEAKKIVFLYN
ncbi:MAG: hypothetical protein WC915_01875 [archaeon]|jgi:hypothetical protein